MLLQLQVWGLYLLQESGGVSFDPISMWKVMLNQLTSVLSNENTNIRSLEAKTETDHDGGVVEMTVDVRDKKQLEKLVSAMRRISGVRDVERLFN